MTKVIHNPALASVVDNGANSSSFVIEPLHAGYGNTLGNSLRRVLLSSIRGAAIVAFRIEGATHEFTTVKGVKEDVVDIMLNLKGVKVISHSDEPVEVRLEKKAVASSLLLTSRRLLMSKSLTLITSSAPSMTRKRLLSLTSSSNQDVATTASKTRQKAAFTAI